MILSVVIFSLGLICCPQAAAFTSPVVDLGYARYQGVENKTLALRSFFSIPYAEPPTGSRRWKAPVPIDVRRSRGVPPIRNATIPGNICLQSGPVWAATQDIGILIYISAQDPGLRSTFGLDSYIQNPNPEPTRPTGEDCLTLDVYIPTQRSTGKLLPVVLQIHGGGYVGGSSTSTGAQYLASKFNGSAVLVSIQYRLGPFGFMNSDEIRRDGNANVGLMDQRVAFEWVQRHIQSFGGDPRKVTIWGGSGGGGAVLNHLIYKGGEKNPPFRAAFAEFPWMPPYRNKGILEAQYADFLAGANCTTLRCLRQVPASTLAAASTQAYTIGYQKGLYGFGDTYYGPSIDGTIIRDFPSVELEKGHFSRVPLMTDINRHEGFSFSNTSISTERDRSLFLHQFFPRASPAILSKLQKQLYPSANYTSSYLDQNPVMKAVSLGVPRLANNSAYFATEALFGAFIIQCPTYFLASAYSKANLPVWKMRFNGGSALHGAVSEYQLGYGGVKNATLANDVIFKYLLSFMTDTDPNKLYPGALPAWPQYGRGRAGVVPKNAIFDVYDDHIVAVTDPIASEKCDVFAENARIIS